MRRSLRILNLYDCIATGSVGGVEQRNLELATFLAGRGHHVTLAGWADAAAEPTPGVRILPLRSRRRLYTRHSRRSTGAALRLAADAARIDLSTYDVVDTANIPYLHLLPLAARCRARRRPLVVTWHEYWGRYWRDYLRGPAWPAYALVERLCAPLGTAAVAVSRLTAERLALRRRQEVPVLPNGIPVEEIQAVAREERRTGPPMVYAGRLLPEKRLDLLLHALAVLRPRVAERPLLALVGDGPDSGRLQRIARELGLAREVEFTGRLASSRDVWRRLARARVAVQPSSREGFGLFPLEALAAGLPVVYCASPESAVGEVVRDGVEGVVSAAEPEALAETLARLLDPDAHERLESMAGAARLRAEQYSWSAVGERVEDLYGQVVSRHPGGVEGA